MTNQYVGVMYKNLEQHNIPKKKKKKIVSSIHVWNKQVMF